MGPLRLLRAGSARTRRLERQGDHRDAGWTADRPECKERQARMDGADLHEGMAVLHHRRAAGIRWRGGGGQRRCGPWRAWLRQRLGCEHRQVPVEVLPGPWRSFEGAGWRRIGQCDGDGSEDLEWRMVEVGW